MEAGNGAASKKQYLFMIIHEAWGLSKEQEPVWDDTFQEGYVRVELRGGPRVQKMTTFTQNVDNYNMEWGQEIRMELTEASKELRILLCKEKPKDQTKKSTPVVAACGIFIKDIIEAVPIDKAFELFKPGESAEASLGGYIRVTLRTGPNVPSVPTIEEGESHLQGDREEPAPVEQPVDEPVGNKGNFLRILLLAGIAATITIIRMKTHKKRNS